MPIYLVIIKEAAIYRCYMLRGVYCCTIFYLFPPPCRPIFFPPLVSTASIFFPNRVLCASNLRYMLIFSMITKVILFVFYSSCCGLHDSSIYPCFSLCDCPYAEKNSVFIPLSRFFLGFLLFLFLFSFFFLKFFPPTLNFFPPAFIFFPIHFILGGMQQYTGSAKKK